MDLKYISKVLRHFADLCIIPLLHSSNPFRRMFAFQNLRSRSSFQNARYGEARDLQGLIYNIVDIVFSPVDVHCAQHSGVGAIKFIATRCIYPGGTKLFCGNVLFSWGDYILCTKDLMFKCICYFLETITFFFKFCDTF